MRENTERVGKRRDVLLALRDLDNAAYAAGTGAGCYDIIIDYVNALEAGNTRLTAILKVKESDDA